MDNGFIEYKDNHTYKIGIELYSLLLKDKSSGGNIIWGTTDYAHKGSSYFSKSEIKPNLITGYNAKIIRPRIEKSQKEQIARVKNKAEVFTPSWVCNQQNNSIDDIWFEGKNPFNTETECGWITNISKVQFPTNKTWIDYVKLKRLEITCGEAPYLTSRYDSVNGEYIDVNNRIGLYDRKLRVISENVDNKIDWIANAILATKSIYGYDWQGDNVLLSRENILFSFIEYYYDKFSEYPDKDVIVEIVNIIVWNIFQMDGLKYVIPNSCKPMPKLQISLFDDEEELEECEGCLTGNNAKHTGIYCKVMDWEKKKSTRFIDIIDGRF